MSRADPPVAVVVAWNGGEALDRCIHALRADGVRDMVLVENGSQATEQARVREKYGQAQGVEIVMLADNCGFAGGANVGFRAAMALGASSVLLLTQDVEIETGAAVAMSEALDGDARAGIVGPLVLDSSRGDRELSRGERVIGPLLCVPRALLRHRRAHAGPYEVSGVMGCVMLLSRACLDATGGFDVDFFAYYEEVDLCIRARRAGFKLLCAPQARARHDGMRGFRAGLFPLSAELKARNLILLARKLGGAGMWTVFVPTYAALIGGSLALYGARGRWDVVRGLLRGALAGVRGRAGALARAEGSPA